MPIIEKQLLRVNEDALVEFLQKGRTPTVRELALKISKFMENADSGPTMRPRFQRFQQRWDHHSTNQVLKDIQFDLDVAYAELVDRLAEQVRRAGFVELNHISQSRELDRILAVLENLLLVESNTEGNFYGVYDTFDDLSKVDLTKTVRDAIDLNAGVALLPHNDPSSDRVDMSHLYQRQQWPVLVEATSVERTSTEEDTSSTVTIPARIVQNEPAPQAWFGLAWQDMINSWRQVVTTNNSLGATMQFSVPISEYDDREVTITRIAVASSSADSMEVAVLHSNDNVNWLKFPGTLETYELKPGKTLFIDFEETRLQYVRFRMTLRNPTFVKSSSNSYVFGLRGIAFYKMGRAQQAEIFSKPLRATGMTAPVDRVSLSVVEDVPGKCDIDYFVAADDGTGNPRNDLWLPIQPSSRDTVENVPRIIKFADSGLKSRPIMAPSPSLRYDTVRNIDYYLLNETPLEHEPIYGTARLYRGENAWFRNTQKEIEVRHMRDAFIDFTTGDVQKLYAIKNDVPEVSITPLTWQGTLGTAHTLLKVSSDIDYDDSRMGMTPSRGVNTGADEQPSYAIYKVERIRDIMSYTDVPVTLNQTQLTHIVDSNDEKVHWLDGRVQPTVTNSVYKEYDEGGTTVGYQPGEKIYKLGRDYLLEFGQDPLTGSQDPYIFTGRIQRPVASADAEASHIDNGEVVHISFNLSSDITSMVQSISGKEIHLSQSLGTHTDQHFRVSYRFVPTPPDATIVKSTVRVTSGFGDEGGEETYSEGPDYFVDPRSGKITRTTRVNGGTIPNEGVVYVDFAYRVEPKNLSTFTTWVWVSDKTGVLIEYSPYSIDVEYGERVAVDGVDVSNASAWPTLKYGWHQVVVRSKSPETDTSAAILKVTEMKERNNRPVFIIGAFFTRMVAQRLPMKQVPYLQLTKAIVPSNHERFAITSSRHVILNFEPGQTDEIYTHGLRYDSGTLQPGDWQEEYTLEYSYALDTSEPVDNILFRALLRRSGDSESSAITPKLLSYHVRVAQ